MLTLRTDVASRRMQDQTRTDDDGRRQEMNRPPRFLLDTPWEMGVGRGREKVGDGFNWPTFSNVCDTIKVQESVYETA